ncbi:hypothetical protein ACFL1X_11870, partial [Candidatus Hydrogenedentota bacterium]
AREKVEDLAKKLAEVKLDPQEMKKLANEFSELSKMLGGENSELGKALSNLAQKMAAGDMEGAMSGMEGVKMSLDDLASVMEQLNAMNVALTEMVQWEVEKLGPSDFCRWCGVPLDDCKVGEGCKGCGSGQKCSGLCGMCGGMAGIGGVMGYSEELWMSQGGMRGPGRGQGGMTGELPDVSANFTPTFLKGVQTQGKIIASVMQKGKPDADAEPTLEYIEGAFSEVRQEAEQALTKEEIPAGSKEFVRQYFGSLEPGRGQ